MIRIDLVQKAVIHFLNPPKRKPPYFVIKDPMSYACVKYGFTMDSVTFCSQRLFAKHGFWVAVCGDTARELFVARRFSELPANAFVSKDYQVKDLNMPHDMDKYPYRLAVFCD